jgi:hypothetical protein
LFSAPYPESGDAAALADIVVEGGGAPAPTPVLEPETEIGVGAETGTGIAETAGGATGVEATAATCPAFRGYCYKYPPPTAGGTVTGVCW